MPIYDQEPHSGATTDAPLSLDVRAAIRTAGDHLGGRRLKLHHRDRVAEWDYGDAAPKPDQAKPQRVNLCQCGAATVLEIQPKTSKAPLRACIHCDAMTLWPIFSPGAVYE